MFLGSRQVPNEFLLPSGTHNRYRVRWGDYWLYHSHWLVGLLTTASLSILFLLMEPSASFWAMSAFLLLLWGLWAWRHPFSAFASLIFVWVTLYTRTTIPMFQVEGSGNRGGIILGDLLWVVFAGVWLAHFALNPRSTLPIMRERVGFLLLLLIPYIGLSVLLPILGVLAGAPASFAIPGVRHLQWVSFAWFGYWFARRMGILELLKMVFAVLSIAGICHTLYSLVQLLVFSETLPYTWLELDRLYRQRFAFSWFFYPRTTGLLVNPNSYGLFGSVLLIFLTALILSGMQLNPLLKALSGVCGLWAVATSASRSGLTGLTAGVVILLAIAYLKAVFYSDWHQVSRVVGLTLKVLLSVVGSVGVLLFLFPSNLFDRFSLLMLTFFEGASADPNAIGRFELWQGAIQLYEERFPWGSWVPLGYITGNPIDSYWVTLLVQGTPVYLFAFLAFLVGVLWHGVNLAFTTTERSLVGYIGAGISVMVGVSSFTLSPILQPEMLVPFWTLVGLLLAKSKPCAHSCS